MKKIIKYSISFIKLGITKIKYKKRFFLSCGVKRNTITKIGRRCKIILDKQSTLSIGMNVTIENNVIIHASEANIKIGNGCFFNENCRLIALEKIIIGKDCIFGPNVGLYDHDHKFSKKDIPISQQGYTKKSIEIGENVWIGANSVITSGVKICDFVVVAANSVVTKNITESGVYAGVPVKLIKKF